MNHLSDSSQQMSYVHLQPFRISQSVINLKEKFLQSKNITNIYQRLNLLKGQNNLLSTQDYHIIEKNLITKFLASNDNISSKKVLEQGETNNEVNRLNRKINIFQHKRKEDYALNPQSTMYTIL